MSRNQKRNKPKAMLTSSLFSTTIPASTSNAPRTPFGIFPELRSIHSDKDHAKSTQSTSPMYLPSVLTSAAAADMGDIKASLISFFQQLPSSEVQIAGSRPHSRAAPGSRARTPHKYSRPTQNDASVQRHKTYTHEKAVHNGSMTARQPNRRSKRAHKSGPETDRTTTTRRQDRKDFAASSMLNDTRKLTDFEVEQLRSKLRHRISKNPKGNSKSYQKTAILAHNRGPKTTPRGGPSSDWVHVGLAPGKDMGVTRKTSMNETRHDTLGDAVGDVDPVTQQITRELMANMNNAVNYISMTTLYERRLVGSIASQQLGMIDSTKKNIQDIAEQAKGIGNSRHQELADEIDKLYSLRTAAYENLIWGHQERSSPAQHMLRSKIYFRRATFLPCNLACSFQC